MASIDADSSAAGVSAVDAGKAAPPSGRRLLRAARRHLVIVGSVVEVATSDPVVVMTFDDGPQPGGTDAVLNVLAGHRASATFFVLLSRVRRHPGLLADIVAAGHEIALHGPDHRSLTGLAYREICTRTRDARAELEDRADRPVRWIRPPYGRQTLRSWHAVRRAGLVPVMWSASTRDSRHVSDGERLEAAARATRGCIVLAHDGFADRTDGADDGPAPQVDRKTLVHRVLNEYESRGLRARSLTDALATGSAVRAAWFGR
jgi:peptidoglycan/xylan/chitin deacetylase (PgdA/CDA1 family)